jgi:hypothetical protein
MNFIKIIFVAAMFVAEKKLESTLSDIGET